MIHLLPSDDDLLQGRLDGTLTPEETVRLDRRLAESAVVRERAEQLAALAEAFAFVKTTDPAPAIARRVMSHIHSHSPIDSIGGRRASIPVRQEAGMSQAGHAKKVIWGLAAAAVVVLGVWLVNGRPDIGGPAAGTVGVAKRYAAPQIADEDVKLEASAQTIQAFLDSEAFARVMADPEAVALLGDPAVRSAIAAHAAHSDAPSPVDNAAIAAVIDDPSFVVLVSNPAFETSWNDAAKKVTEMKSAVGQGQLGQNAAGLNSGLNQKAAGVNSELNRNASGLNSGLNQNAAGLNSSLNQKAAGVNSELNKNASGLNSGLNQNAAGLNSGLKQNAAGVNSGLNQNAAGLNSGLNQNAAGLNSGLKLNAAGINSQLSSQLQTQISSQLRVSLGNQLHSLQSSLKSGLGNSASQ